MMQTGRFFRLGLAALVLMVFGATGAARAQSSSTDAALAPPPQGGGPGMHGPDPFGPGDEMMGFLGFEMGMHGKTVTGAPFSASFSVQTTQAMADGNQIQRNTTGTIARDTQGRTHRDMTLPAIGPWATSGEAAPRAIFIDDPVAGTHFVLDPNKKTAVQENHKPADFRPDKGDRSENKAERRDSNNVVTTDLGTQNINGIAAQGTRTTHTIPAGEIGNVKPIVITTERWYSSDLQTNVMTKRTDPRNGETTITQLTNIQRAEPDATLFQVPADYTVTAGRARGENRKHQGPPPPPPQE
jgi:hypothetical protein